MNTYMAISTAIPTIGERFKCNRAEQSGKSEISFRGVTTSPVRKVKKMAGNVYVATTQNSMYVVRIVQFADEHVQFAVITDEPQKGAEMICKKIIFDGYNAKSVAWRTTAVRRIRRLHGLFLVHTRNSIYVCFLHVKY